MWAPTSRTRWAAREPEGLIGIHVNLARGGVGHRRQAAGAIRSGTRGTRCGRDVQDDRLRLLPGAVHPATDDRLLPAGFTRRARGLVARPRHGQLPQDLPRVRRGQARGQSHAADHRRQHHAVLADGHRRLSRPVVLGVRAVSAAAIASGKAPPPVKVPVALHDVPRRALAAPRSWVEAVYPGVAYFNQVDRGGHFAAWEEPALFTSELRAAFKPLR